MRKMIVCALVGALVLTGCQQIDLSNEVETTENTRNVQFVMKGLQVDYTRATLASDGMTDLWVFEGETLLKHQTSTDADFGAPTVTLTIGAHDLTFIASKSQGQTFDTRWHCTKVGETFGTVLAYTVTASSTSKQVQLSRLNGSLSWTIEDAIPSDVQTMQFSITNQCYGLDAELNGTDPDVYEVNANISSKVGMTGFAPTTSVLPADHTNGSTVSAYIKIASATATLCEYTNNVGIAANQVTNIHGKFFAGTSPLAIGLNTDWGVTINYDVR